MSDIKYELWRVADDFASHMRLLDILKSNGEDTGPLEQTIAEYFTHEVTREKIDSVIGYIRHCYTMEAAALKEMQRCRELAESYGMQAHWVKDCAKGVLEMSGQKRLEGLTAGSLTLRANGGRQAVEITDASLVPEEFVQYTGTISDVAWRMIRDAGKAHVQMERIPHKGRIGEALSRKCGVCAGTGEIGGNVAAPIVCNECGGDGLACVPGARLEPRGNSVILK